MAEEKKAAPESEPEVSREELYKQYQDQNSVPAEEKEPEAPKAETAPEEAEKEKEQKEPEKEKEVKPEIPEAEKWKAATYEERMKRKAVNEALEKERRRAAELEAEINAIKSKRNEPEPDGEITDYDKALLDERKANRELSSRVEAIESLERKRVERERQEAIERAKRETDQQLDQTHKDLLNEGFYGFKHSIGRIQAELVRLVNEDEANVAMDNPAGWKKLYREVVFPELKAEQEAADKARSVAEKTELKKQANLTGPGTKPVKKVEAEKTEFERHQEYIRNRRGGE